MHESPRVRRLRSDLGAMERLCEDSSVTRFRVSGTPAQHYVVEFRGKSLARFQGKVTVREHHEVEIKLGAGYPRTMPEIRWLTPIYHPNISEIGMVCLGGYGTHWVPSLNLDELCGMLWDMARFHNYDVRSPYNREAALWVANQTTFKFPMDARPLRDLRQALGRIDVTVAPPTKPEKAPEAISLAAKYRIFLKKFSEELGKSNPAASAILEDSEPATPPPDPAGLESVTVVAAAETPIEMVPTASVVVDETAPDLVLLESLEDHGSPLRLEENQAVRLRAAAEEILFLD